ncbi:MAG: AMP-binding protein [Chloroflexi bacterium]|nr:AMP-binding protein [Chloroflexota bacterium]
MRPFAPEVTERYRAQGYWREPLVIDCLDKAVRRCPDKVAIVHGDRCATYRELGLMAKRLALSFLEMGLGRDAIVGAQLPTSPEAAAIVLALARIGAIYMPINYLLRARDVRYLMQYSRAAAIIIPATFKGFNYPAMVAELRSGLPDLRHVLVLGDSAPTGTVSTREMLDSPIETRYPEDHLEPFKPGGDEAAWLAHTSGTEAEPKGVLRTHYVVGYGAFTGIAKALGFREDSDDTVLVMPGITSTFGLSGLNVAIGKRGTAVLTDVFEPQHALQSIEREKVTHLMATPAHIITMLRDPSVSEYDYSSLRSIFYGSAPCPTEIIMEAKARFKANVVTVYNSTEVAIVTLTSENDPPEVTARTVGKPVPGMAVRIVDEYSRDVGTGEEGEIMVKGPGVMGGYYSKPELDSKAFDAEGWFRMGDLGLIDDDGNLRITGRKKDIIIRGGQNISAREVEDLLYGHPKVRDAAVVAMPDARLGEKSCAYVVPRPGESVTLEEIVQFLLSKEIAKFKLPERLELIERLPVNAMGKVQKFVLRQDIARKLKEEE